MVQLINMIADKTYCGSGGCEGTWKTNYDYIFASTIVGKIYLFWIRETLHEVNGWKTFRGHCGTKVSEQSR